MGGSNDEKAPSPGPGRDSEDVEGARGGVTPLDASHEPMAIPAAAIPPPLVVTESMTAVIPIPRSLALSLFIPPTPLPPSLTGG